MIIDLSVTGEELGRKAASPVFFCFKGYSGKNAMQFYFLAWVINFY